MDRRIFLMAVIANGMLAAAPDVFADVPFTGEAIRTATNAIRLTWSGNAPVAIFVSSDPDAQRFYMHELKSAVRGGATALSLGVSPRPYLLLVTQNSQTRVAERLLPLKGGRNFRDLGGYYAQDGRQVRWGRIYRSGVMSSLTDADMDYLSNLGIEVICDLRSNEERTAEPNPFLGGDAPQIVATDYDMPSTANLQAAANRDQAIDAFAAAYLGFIDFLAPQYTDIFARLVRRQAPLAFNCSAGKDRSGVGAALILSVLGVPRDVVVADYALTQVYTPPSFYMKQISNPTGMSSVSRQQAKAFASMPPEVLEVIMGSDPEVMRRTFVEIDRKFGGPIELAKARFGLTDTKITHLRNTYLI